MFEPNIFEPSGWVAGAPCLGECWQLVIFPSLAGPAEGVAAGARVKGYYTVRTFTFNPKLKPGPAKPKHETPNPVAVVVDSWHDALRCCMSMRAARP